MKIMFAWTLMSVRISMMVKKFAQMVGVSIGILDMFAFVIRDSYHHKIRKHASMPGRVRLRMDFQDLHRWRFYFRCNFVILAINMNFLKPIKRFFSPTYYSNFEMRHLIVCNYWETKKWWIHCRLRSIGHLIDDIHKNSFTILVNFHISKNVDKGE